MRDLLLLLIWYAVTFHPPWKVWPVYRVLDEDGSVRADAIEPKMSKDLALKIYGNMIRLEAMDDIFYNAQRQVVVDSLLGVERGKRAYLVYFLRNEMTTG